ncbi:uncharacterized protein rnf214 [Eucyclogobius newberryi]|uniref:uncharacterized protein rnf214 n=1 Tax=Eucyclogobius newberryi TaxID=166745 RepID=UPI003B5A311C
MAGLVCSRDAGQGAGSRLSVDSGTNTEPDWEDRVRTMLDSSSKVNQDFNALKVAQQQDELDFSKSQSHLQKKKNEAVKQHQALLEKMQSVRVKLQLNNNKAMRKNFLSKIQEMTSERDHAQEERDKLVAELAEAELQRSALEEEQKQEQSRWDQELSELRRQTERAQTEAREAVCRAQRDERMAVERQRDVANERVEAWLNQVSVYLSGLRAELPVRLRQEKPLWEKKEASVKQKQSELQAAFSDLLLQLQRGEDLENLPQVHLPVLPLVPMAELYFHRIMQMTPRPPAPPPAPLTPPPHFRAPPLLPTPHRPAFHPQPFLRPPPPRFVVTSLPVHAPPPPAQTPPLAAAPAPPAAAAFGTLGKLLDRLRGQFPQCSGAELTKLLQQVKTDRGTLAGLSMEDVIERVRLKVGAAPGPAAPTAAPAASAPRKPCLMCQKPIEPGAKFELSCVHTLHKECVRVWLKSNNNCPFCPSKA